MSLARFVVGTRTKIPTLVSSDWSVQGVCPRDVEAVSMTLGMVPDLKFTPI